MKTTREKKLVSRGARRRTLPLAAAALILVGSAVVAQQPLHAKPYGEPSECAPGGPASLGLYYQVLDTGAHVLRLEGGDAGQPAVLAISAARAEMPLPEGGTLLLGSAIVHRADGTFDASGTFTWPLDTGQFGEQVALFAQGFQPVGAHESRGIELSGGLELTLGSEPEAPAEPEPETPPVLVEEFAGMLAAGHLEAALDTALNSEGDTLTLDLGGQLEVPVAPGVTVGGKAAFKASVKRGESDSGAVHYDVAIGRDVAASAGVGAGVVGAGASLGVGDEIVWRYSSTHQVARALRSMAVLQAVGDGLEHACLVLDRKAASIDRAIGRARRIVDRVRSALRWWMPWRDNAVVRRLQAVQDRMRARRRQIVDRGRHAIRRLIGWVATERTFLDDHVNGFEMHLIQAANGSVQTPGFGNSEEGGEWNMANLGAGAAVGIERQFALIGERVPGSTEWKLVRNAKFTKSIDLAAGFVIGGSASGKRVIEVRHERGVGATLKLTLDGNLRAVLGAVVAGQAGIGGEVALELELRDLFAYSADAIAILLSDDTDAIARLLRAVPIRFHTRGRYEAGLAIGIGVKIDGAFKAGIGGSAMMIDCGPGFECEGAPEGNTLIGLLSSGPLDTFAPRTATRLDEVKREVASAMRR